MHRLHPEAHGASARHSNIAMEEQVTVVEYIAVARDILAAQGVAAATAEEAAAAVEELGAEVCNYQNQSCIDIEKAKRVLGWEPTPFADAMRDTVDWCAAATRLHPTCSRAHRWPLQFCLQAHAAPSRRAEAVGGEDGKVGAPAKGRLLFGAKGAVSYSRHA